jgi:dTDP-4-dehydrorhamnose reductase
MRILVTGASGRLGAYLVERLKKGAHEVLAWSGSTRGHCGGIPLRPLDLTDASALLAALRETDPEVVIHAAAVSSAEAVYREPERGESVNVAATQQLAAWAQAHDRRLVFTSTDLVFDGSKSWYREEEPADPILEYGRSKRAAERFVTAIPRGVVARISLLFGPTSSGRPGYFDRALVAARRGEPQAFFADEFRTPLDYATAAEVVVRLAEREATGIVHVGGRERLSRFELMSRALRALGTDPALIRPNRQCDVPVSEPRPADVSLDTTRLAALFPDLARPSVEESLAARSP